MLFQSEAIYITEANPINLQAAILQQKPINGHSHHAGKKKIWNCEPRDTS